MGALEEPGASSPVLLGSSLDQSDKPRLVDRRRAHRLGRDTAGDRRDRSGFRLGGTPASLEGSPAAPRPAVAAVRTGECRELGAAALTLQAVTILGELYGPAGQHKRAANCELMPTNEVEVRAGDPHDAESVARIHVETWQRAYAHVFPQAGLDRLAAGLDGRIQFWRETIESDENVRVLVACQEARIIGFASGGPSRDEGADPTREGELYAIYVLPEAWGTGAGRALNTCLLALLRADGFEEAVLWVLDDNPRARRFYELASWRLDGGVKEDTFLDTPVREVRYRIALRSELARKTQHK
jgi:ribosomal protein S18 acetylase RimI-like enzyme